MQIRLRMPVVGPRGSAEAVVEQRGGDTISVHVQLPGGGRINVGSGGGGGGGGRVIDVDWKEVR